MLATPPRYLSASSHGAPAVVRPHWSVSDKPIAGPRSEELAKTREVFQSSFQFDLAGGVRLERTDLPEDESAQCLRVGDDRDIGGSPPAVNQRGRPLNTDREVVFLPVPEVHPGGPSQPLE